MDYNDTADPKSPTSTLFHQLDGRTWLPAGLTLAGAVTVTVSPAGELLVDQCSSDGQYINYRVRGGVAERDYIVTFFFSTTTGGWSDDYSVRYPVR